jgi:hypothetical protein
MAKDPKTVIEQAMPGYRLVDETARPRGIDSAADALAPPPADLRGVDFAKLQELYLGSSQAAARPRSLDAASSSRNTSRIVTVEKQSLMDSPKVGRKAVIIDDDDGEIVGKQG